MCWFGFQLCYYFVSDLIHNFLTIALSLAMFLAFFHNRRIQLWDCILFTVLAFLWTSVGIESNPFLQNQESGWRKES